MLVVVAGSSYAAIELVSACTSLPGPVMVVIRLRLGATLYDPAAPRKPGTKGTPCKKGLRQPALAQRLDDPDAFWQKVTLRWYGGTSRQVELANGTAVWYHSGLPVVPLRWVLIRDPVGQFESQALLSTDQIAVAQQLVECFVLRWQLEVTFQEARTHLGIETQCQWSALAIARTTPALLGLFSLITLFAHQLLQGQDMPVRQAAWY